MNTPATNIVAINDPQKIARCYAEKGLSWGSVIAFLPARFLLAFLAEAIMAGVLWRRGVPDPWQTSYGWWMVYGTFADIGCLALLVWLTRRENIRIFDLLGLDRESFGTQMKYFPGYFLAFLVPVIFTFVISGLFYGQQMAPQISAIHVPGWARLYSVVVWPVIWCFIEDIVYLGYLLPRLEARLKRLWLAASIVILFWGGQHVVIPFILDSQYLLSRFITSVVAVGGLTLIFLGGGRRMIPAFSVHWTSNILAAFLANFLISG